MTEKEKDNKWKSFFLENQEKEETKADLDLKKLMKKPSMMFKSLPPKQKKNKKKKR